MGPWSNRIRAFREEALVWFRTHLSRSLGMAVGRLGIAFPSLLCAPATWIVIWKFSFWIFCLFSWPLFCYFIVTAEYWVLQTLKKLFLQVLQKGGCTLVFICHLCLFQPLFLATIDADKMCTTGHLKKLWKLILLKNHKLFIILPEGGSKVTIRSWVKIFSVNTRWKPNKKKKREREREQTRKTMKCHLLI